MDCIVYEIPMVYTKSKGIDEAFILVVALGYVDYRSNDNIVRVYKHTWIGRLYVPFSLTMKCWMLVSRGWSRGATVVNRDK